MVGLLALVPLAFPVSVSANDLATKGVAVKIQEGTSSIEFNEGTTQEITFDLSQLPMSETVTEELNIDATINNPTLKEFTGYVTATSQGAGLAVKSGEQEIAIISNTAQKLNTAKLEGTFQAKLTLADVVSTEGYSITLTATDVSPLVP